MTSASAPGSLLGGRVPAPVASAAVDQGTGPHAPGTAIVARIAVKRPVEGHQGPIRTLHLREPKLRDFIDCGPVVGREVFDGADGAARVEITEDYSALMRWLERLSGHPGTLLGSLGNEDARAALAGVSRIVLALDLGNSGAAPPS